MDDSNGVENGKLLRNLPPTPESEYIFRTPINETICDQLKNIHQSEGRIIVHGISGSGKTISVCQSVRHVFHNENCFQTQGCYWIKIGSISKQQLFAKLYALSLSLGIDWYKKPICLKEIDIKLNEYLRGNKDLCDVLFIYDDVCDPDYYNYLTFATKSIATSQLDPTTKDKDIVIPMPEQLTNDEVTQLLVNCKNNQRLHLPEDNPTLRSVIKSCYYLPFAANIIANLELDAEKEWKTLDQIMKSKQTPDKISDYKFNLYGLLNFVTDQLTGDDKKLFRLLGVFKATEIHIESVISLWQVDEAVATGLLQRLHSRSLLHYDKERRSCSLHDQVINYLLLPIDEDMSRQQYYKLLNKKLLDGYSQRCQSRWYKYPKDDHYFYQFLVSHALCYQNDDILDQIIMDFNWLGIKIQQEQSVHNACMDIADYMDYLQSKNQDNWKFVRLYHMLENGEPKLIKGQYDGLQTMLLIANQSDWTYEHAANVARQKAIEDGSQYWIKSHYIRKWEKINIYWVPNRSVASNLYTYTSHLSFSNPNYGKLRFLCALDDHNKKSTSKRIAVIDYNRLQEIYHSDIPSELITQASISADGRTIAICDKDEWKVYDIESNKQLHFLDINQDRVEKDDISDLQFCPVINDYGYLAYLSKDKQHLVVCDMKSDGVHLTTNCYTNLNGIKYFNWSDDGQQIIIQENFVDDKSRPNKKFKSDVLSSINTCQVEIWNLHPWKCLKTLKIPSFIEEKDGKYFPSEDQNCLPLQFFHCACNPISYLILVYEGAVGLINLEINEQADINLVQGFQSSFRCFINNQFDVRHIQISKNQQFILIDGKENNIILKMENGQIQSYFKFSDIQRAIMIPETNELVAKSDGLNSFNLQDQRFRWQNLQENDKINLIYPLSHSSTNDKTRDFSYAYINNQLVVITMEYTVDSHGDHNYELMTCTYQNGDLISTTHMALEGEYTNCFIFDNMQSVYLINFKYSVPYSYRYVTITEVKNFLNQDQMEIKQLLKYNVDEDEYSATFYGMHRKLDNNIIFLMKQGPWIFVFRINAETGEVITYQDNRKRFRQHLMHFNEFGFLTIHDDVKSIDSYQISLKTVAVDVFGKDIHASVESSGISRRKCLTYFEIGVGDTPTQIKKTVKLNKKPTVCQIILPTDDSICDIETKTSPLDVDEATLTEIWGSKFGPLIHETHKNEDRKVFIIQKGDNFIITNRTNNPCWIGQKGSVINVSQERNRVIQFQSLWHQFHNILLYSDQTRALGIYNSQTGQKIQSIYLHRFDLYYAYQILDATVQSSDKQANPIIFARTFEDYMLLKQL